MPGACVLRHPGAVLHAESLALHELTGDLVRVRILARGVCRSDLHAVDGSWSTPLPLIPGHEGAGIVEAVGPDVFEIRPGDRVVLAWLAPCRRCRQRAQGRAWLCSRTPEPEGA